MFNSQTHIQSEHAPRYLTTLCRHFARKVPATWDEQQGEVKFVDGLCLMSVANDCQVLEIRCQSAAEEGLAKLESIITQHVKMFERREQLQLAWQRLD